jgi:type VI secretion system secreted protein VgrG
MSVLGYTDAKASLKVTTPLGTDALLLRGFSGEESLSEPFLFALDMVTEHSDLDVTQLVGAAATVTLTDGLGNTRLFNGLVARVTVAGSAWIAELRPWLWMLKLTTDSKIFQSLSIPDIITSVFTSLGFSDYKSQLTGSYSPLDYCVQYQETAFDFVSRLMEQAGIWYFFTHTASAHTLVLADDPSAIVPCENAATVNFIDLPPDKRWLADLPVWDIGLSTAVASGKYQADDFNFETPSTGLTVAASTATGKLQIYDYPGLYQVKADGESLSTIRLQEFAAPTSILSGNSPIRHLRPGAKVTLAQHPVTALNTAWSIRSVSHQASRNEYQNSFSCFPSSITWRSPRRTPRPCIPGTQTAMVTGKAGEEIWTDQYGRIKVQFHWDQFGKNDENSSCWIRVAQSWAGKGWGAWTLPRIGQEVVVSFLEGDPDQPLVTGCVYNGDFPVPYALPDEQTKTTLKTNSSKGGGGSNELRFEDKAGSEEIFVHAQKDMNITVENARTATINTADDTLTVAKGNRSVTVSEGNDTLTISKGNRAYSVATGNETYQVKGTRDATVTGAETHTNKADYTWTISGNLTIKIDGSLTIESQGSAVVKSSADLTVQSGTGLTVKAGTSLAGSSGTGLTLQAGTTLEAKASASGTIDGGGMLAVKGGMVQIN